MQYLKKFIFLSIPKTAAVSIKAALRPHRDKLINGIGPGLKTAVQAKKSFSKEDWDSYFKFTIVRNPWRRIWSNFCFRVGRLETYRDKHRLEKFLSAVKLDMQLSERSGYEDWERGILKNMKTIDNFFNAWGSYKGAFKKIVYDHEPQSDYYLSDEGKNMLDFIMDFDVLREDFSFVCENLKIEPPKKLPHINKVDYDKINLDFEEFYTEDLIEMVSEKDKKTIQLKKYEFS